jgi:hypothetical protein
MPMFVALVVSEVVFPFSLLLYVLATNFFIYMLVRTTSTLHMLATSISGYGMPKVSALQ